MHNLIGPTTYSTQVAPLSFDRCSHTSSTRCFFLSTSFPFFFAKPPHNKKTMPFCFSSINLNEERTECLIQEFVCNHWLGMGHRAPRPLCGAWTEDHHGTHTKLLHDDHGR